MAVNEYDNAYQQNNSVQQIQQPTTALRQYGADNGYDVGWDGKAKKVTVKQNGNVWVLPTEGLTNDNGTFKGTDGQLKNAFANKQQYVAVRDNAVQQGINVGYDQYNHPILNGQSVDTTGWVNIDGRWYAPEGQLQNIINGVKPKDFESEYTKIQKNLLNDLLNYGDFKYSAKDDTYLQDAMELARRQAVRDAENKGQGNSFGMTYAANAAANALIPQYEEKAYNRYLQGRNYLADLYGLANQGYQSDLDTYRTMRGFSNDDREYNADQEDRGRQLALGERQQDYNEYADRENWKRDDYRFEAERQDKNNQWDAEFGLELDKWAAQKQANMDERDRALFQQAYQTFVAVGSIPNETIANILGLPVGTTTLEAAQMAAQNANYWAQAGYHNAQAAKTQSEINKNDEDVSKNLGYTGT